MRNVIATVCQVVALGFLLVGLWVVAPYLAGAAGFGVVGWLLAPERAR